MKYSQPLRILTTLTLVVAGFSLAGPVGAGEIPQPGAPAAKACTTGFGSGAFGGYLPSSAVKPGQQATAELRWESGRLAGSKVTEVIGCVSVNGELADDLATSLGPADNDGAHAHVFTVPSDTPAGAKVCERALLLGTTLTREPTAVRTNPVCFTVAAAAAAATAGAAANMKESTTAAVAGATETRSAAATPETAAAQAAALDTALPRTGAAERALAALAGLLFLLGGFAVMVGRTQARLSA